MEKFKRRLSRLPGWILTVMVIAAILWLTLSPHPLGEEELPLFPGADKIAHACMFGGLVFTILVDWTRGRNFTMVRWSVCVAAATFSTLFGIAIELLQRMMEMGRGFEYTDMLADGVGSFTVAAIWILAEKFRD